MIDAVPDAPALHENTVMRSEVATPHASRYLQQLCKHFAHKLAVSFDAHQGRIAFPAGECRLDADDGTSRMRLVAPGAPEMAQLMSVMQRHLVRFAFREDLEIDWRVG